MPVFVAIIVVIALAVFGYFVFRRFMSRWYAVICMQVLQALADSRKPMNVSEIAEAVGQNGGVIVKVVQTLYKHELIASTARVRRREAASDQGRYAITKLGKAALRDRVFLSPSDVKKK